MDVLSSTGEVVPQDLDPPDFKVDDMAPMGDAPASPMDLDHQPVEYRQEPTTPSANQELPSEAQKQQQQLPTPSPQQEETSKGPKMLSIDVGRIHQVCGQPPPSSPRRTTSVPPGNIQIRRIQKPKAREYKRGELSDILEGIEDPTEMAVTAKAFMHSLYPANGTCRNWGLTPDDSDWDSQEESDDEEPQVRELKVSDEGIPNQERLEQMLAFRAHYQAYEFKTKPCKASRPVASSKHRSVHNYDSGFTSESSGMIHGNLVLRPRIPSLVCPQGVGVRDADVHDKVDAGGAAKVEFNSVDIDHTGCTTESKTQEEVGGESESSPIPTSTSVKRIVLVKKPTGSVPTPGSGATAPKTTDFAGTKDIVNTEARSTSSATERTSSAGGDVDFSMVPAAVRESKLGIALAAASRGEYPPGTPCDDTSSAVDSTGDSDGHNSSTDDLRASKSFCDRISASPTLPRKRKPQDTDASSSHSEYLPDPKEDDDDGDDEGSELETEHDNMKNKKKKKKHVQPRERAQTRRSAAKVDVDARAGSKKGEKKATPKAAAEPKVKKTQGRYKRLKTPSYEL